MLAWTRSQVQTRHIGLSLTDAANVQKLARYLIYPDPFLRLPAQSIASGLGKQSSLWPTSISGDFPIFLVRIGDVADLEIVAQALRFQEYMRARGMMIDFVVVNEQASSYVQDLQRAVETLCENSRLRGKELGPRQHIFAVRRDLMDETTYKTLLAAARVVLPHPQRHHLRPDRAGRGGGAAGAGRNLPAVAADHPETAATRAARPCLAAAAPRRRQGRGHRPGARIGTALAASTATAATMSCAWPAGARRRSPGSTSSPTPSFGFHTSAEGAAFTWSRNSRDYQLTPWSNDPVTNRPGEAIYIYDQASGRAFSPIRRRGARSRDDLRGLARPGLLDLPLQARAADRWISPMSWTLPIR